MRPRARHRWLARVSREHGFAVPTVLLAMIAVFGLATTTIIATVGAQQGTTRDQNTKAALGIAEAGVANALMRFNRIRTLATTPTDDCTPVGGTVLGVDGWCPQAVPGAIDRGTYSYRVRPTGALGSTPGALTIVSTGTVDGVSRRVTAVANTVSVGYKPFAEFNIIGLDGITIDSNSHITAQAATNGDIGIASNSVLDCGDGETQVGVGRGYNPRGSNTTATCDPPDQGQISLPPVNPGDVATNNSNARICTLDPIQGTSCATAWNPVTKRLELKAGDSITLGSAGGEFNYAFCKVRLRSNSYFYVANGAEVRVYFLAPEQCANEPQPLELMSNSQIRASDLAGPANLAILIVGSATRPTTLNLNSNTILFSCDQTFALYAPRTAIDLDSNINICGGIAGKSIHLDSNVTMTAENTAGDFELPGTNVPAHYGQPTEFVECGPPPASGTPDAGC